MSAYIVEDFCIKKVITYLLDSRAKAMESHISGPVKGLGYDLSRNDGCLKLAKDMLAMNVEAVAARYGSADSEKFGAFSEVHCSKIQAYKSLQCFLYQCTEGDVDEKPLYKALKEVENSLAASIVNELPEYDKAVWG